jgi:hypothetical protein
VFEKVDAGSSPGAYNKDLTDFGKNSSAARIRERLIEPKADMTPGPGHYDKNNS